VQPEVIVIGGSVGGHLSRFKDFLEKELKKFETPLIPIPPIRQAQRPDDAVLYGCYDLAKSVYGKAD
jgi:predicted NBD/HSP70 family sugar kinase